MLAQFQSTLIQVYYQIRGELLIIMTDVILNSTPKVYYKNYTIHRRQVYACGSTDVSDKLSQSKTLQSTTSCRLTTGSIIYFYWRLKKVIQEFKTGRIKSNKKYMLDKDRHTSTSVSNHEVFANRSRHQNTCNVPVLCSEHCCVGRTAVRPNNFLNLVTFPTARSQDQVHGCQLNPTVTTVTSLLLEARTMKTRDVRRRLQCHNDVTVQDVDRTGMT
jgi:hypothetical protein